MIREDLAVAGVRDRIIGSVIPVFALCADARERTLIAASNGLLMTFELTSYVTGKSSRSFFAEFGTVLTREVVGTQELKLDVCFFF